MRIVWKRDMGVAVVDDKVHFTITCDVRNELNGRRKLHTPDDVVFTVTKAGKWGAAYMPRKFPKGVWQITGWEYSDKKDFAPVKIRTDAHQRVELWNLDGAGGYARASGMFEEDFGYHLHWSEFSRTTLGCGRVGTNTDKEVRALALLVDDAFKVREKVILEVI